MNFYPLDKTDRCVIVACAILIAIMPVFAALIYSDMGLL